MDPVAATSNDPSSNDPSKGQEDPWEKACVLTLDGGGIRGYASLWMLKFLMDAVGNIEKEHDDSHESSFSPLLEEDRKINSTIGSSSNEPITPQSGDQITPTLITRRSGFRRVASDSVPLNSSTSCLCGKYEGYLPCHYFDYIAGTSTGGLNAIMLGRLRMRVEDCLERYPEMARNVFGNKRSGIKRLVSTKYDSARLESEIRKIMNSKTPKNGTPRHEEFEFDKYHSPHDLCKTVVVANEWDNVGDKPYLFRTYPNNVRTPGVRNPGEADKNEICKIARATAAAPTYFDPINIGTKEYSDGGMGNNNPAQLMLDEVMAMAGTIDPTQAFAAFVSIGTGQKPTTRLRVKHRFPIVSNLGPVKEISKILKRLKDHATDVERSHEVVQRLLHIGGFNQYYRWTGGEEVGGLTMDEWLPRNKNKPSTDEFIRQKVSDYMQKADIQLQLIACATELVRQRRARIAHRQEDGCWRRYTHCTLIQCIYCDGLLETRKDLKDHIRNIHPVKLSAKIDVDELVNGIPERYPVCRGGPL